MTYLIARRIARSPCTTTKLVSVAPRSSRLNSASLPRLRSHPIHRCFAGVPPPLAVKQEEAVGAMPGVQGVDLPRAPAPASPSSPAIVCASASAKSLSSAKCRCGSRLARKRTSRSWNSDSTRASESMMAGTTTMVRSCAGMPSRKRQLRQLARRDRRRQQGIEQRDRQLADRNQREQRDQPQRAGGGAVPAAIGDQAGDAERRRQRESCRDSRSPGARRRSAPAARARRGG